MKSQHLLVTILCLFALVACTLPAPTATLSIPPTPTLRATILIATSIPQDTLTTAPTQKSTVAAKPVTTAPPTTIPSTAIPTKALTGVPTRLPTPTPTATKSSMPQAPDAILILSPGLNSSIISPVKISGEADSTFEQNLIAKVTGENGLSIGMKSTTIQVELGKRGPFSVEIPFKVTHDQLGRVAVWSSSPKDGGLVHFSSIEVSLKSSGTAKFLSSQPMVEPLVITSPAPAAAFGGGKLHLEGWSAPVFENTLSVVLCGEGGSGKADPFCGTVDNVLARISTIIKAPDIGQPSPFSLDITYKVTKPINGRVAVYFTSPRDGGLLHLSSVPVQLKP
jgi:hypothetical protein